jgi:RNA polymerase sigma factor (sigma-70 family)
MYVFITKRHSAFEKAILPHLDAAHNLARWLTRNDQDAEDIVQEACVRALKYFAGYHGGDAKAWLLAIVRNTCYTHLRRHRSHELALPFDDELLNLVSDAGNPETLFLKGLETAEVHRALEKLPAEFREVIVLREMEGLSYKEIAEVTEIPVGTVMSRLARARRRLQTCLSDSQEKGIHREL